VWNALGGSGGGGGGGGAPSKASSSSSSSSGSSSGGELIRIWTAHNRPVTCLSFSSDGSLVLTAGQDGIVNAFPLLDVVSSPSSDGTTGGTGTSAGAIDNSIRPVRTFSEHHLPVSSLMALPSNRAVSVSSDRQAIVMELCSGATLARIVLPASLRCVAADEAGRRLYAGGEDGVVYCVDLDAVAVRETAESATVVSIGGGGGGPGASKSSTAALVLSGSKLGETILGMKGGRSSAAEAGGSADSRNGGVSELRGHSQAITALAVVDGVGGRGVLVSGSEEGSLRVWDLHTRACARVVQPWGGGAASSTSSTCPVSSILVVPRRGNSYNMYAASASGPFGLNSTRGRGAGSSGADVLDLFRPLQRFPNDKPIGDVVPILTSNRNTKLVRRWEGVSAITEQTSQKRPRTSTNTSEMSSVEPASKDDENDEDDGFLSMSSGAPSNKNTSSEDDEKAALRKELEEARATIKRWEKVNNKLAKKLEKTKEATGK
jgi:WD40 repeat protein